MLYALLTISAFWCIKEELPIPYIEGGLVVAEEQRKLDLYFSPGAYFRLGEMRISTERRADGDVIGDALRFQEWYVNQGLQESVVELNLDEEDVFREAVGLREEAQHVPVIFSSRRWVELEDLRSKMGVRSYYFVIAEALYRYSQYLIYVGSGRKIRVHTKDGRVRQDTLSFLPL